MRRTVALVLAGGVVVAGCGGGGDAAAPPASAPTASSTASTSTTEGEPTTSTGPVPATDAAPATSEAPSIAEVLAQDRPLNIAHAGGARIGPHSTMYAYARSVEAGADVLEADVQLSADGVLVVQHDDTVDRTTNGTGPVADRTFAELAALDAGHWFHPDCWPCPDRPAHEYVFRGVRTGLVPPPPGYGADDFRIITFRELALAFPHLPLDVEIKGELPQAAEVARVLASELRDLDRTASVVVVSFDSAVVEAFAALAPEVATSPGTEELAAWFLAGEPLGDHVVVQVPPVFDGTPVITADFLARAAEAGVEVWAWSDDPATQEDAAFYRRMLELGVDGYIADRPDVLESVIASLDGS